MSEMDLTAVESKAAYEEIRHSLCKRETPPEKQGKGRNKHQNRDDIKIFM